jgi:phosphatidylglycerophosphatase A
MTQGRPADDDSQRKPHVEAASSRLTASTRQDAASTLQSRRFDAVIGLATGAWVGFSPIAPGTVGALWGLPLAWGIAQIGSPAIQSGVIVVLIAAGVPLCTAAARRLGGKKDPGAIVWDEIVTVPMTFFLVPAAQMNHPIVLAAGFLLHRFFDVTKIPPARQLERLPEGAGIVADDVAAGVYSCLALHGLLAWAM